MQGDADRDRAIEHVLKQSRLTTSADETAACIDAETLAAWADGGLSQSQSVQIEQHLSDCARCTAMLATFARTAPDAPATESLWNRWRLAWMVPIATAATAVALWVAIPRNPTTPTPAAQRATENSRTALPTQPSVEGNARFGATARTSPADTLAQRKSAQEADSRDARADLSYREQERARVLPDPIAPATPPTPPEANLEAAEKRAEQFESPAPTAVAPAPPAAATAPAPPSAAAGQTRNAEAPAERSTSRLAVARPAPALLQVTSPDPAFRWRVVGAGQVERSTTGGTRWEPATMPESTTLTAGTSPSPSVCWLVGRTGAIYVTTDGLRFRRVPFPERTDFVSIQASDDRRATVITIDGRTFRTDDQGATWVRVSP